MKLKDDKTMNLLLLTLIPLALGQQTAFDDAYNLARQGNDLMWCVTSKEELEKCQALSKAVEATQADSELAFGSYTEKYSVSILPVKMIA